jgi:Domain of unknown function (DUF4314)
MIASLRAGDRIRLISMVDDPDPIPVGALGTVLDIFQRDGWLQVDVDWDNGRALMLTIPPDVVEVLTK